jgi:hypothetical protein
VTGNNPPRHVNWSPKPNLDDFKPATVEHAHAALRRIGSMLGVPAMLGHPEGDPVATGTCKRCRRDDLELWQLGNLFLCRICWRARAEFNERLDLRIATEPPQHIRTFERPGYRQYDLNKVRRLLRSEPPLDENNLFGERNAA